MSQVRPPVSIPVACGLLGPIDAAAVLLCSALAYVAWLSHASFAHWDSYFGVTLFAALLAVNVFRLAGLYEYTVLTRPSATLVRATLGWCCVAVVLIAVGYFTKASEDYSRGWSALWFVTTLGVVLTSRVAFFRLTRKWIVEGRIYRNVAIVGAGPIGQRLLRHFQDDPDSEIRVVGLFDDRMQRVPKHSADYPVDGNLEALIAHIRSEPVDTVIVAVPWSAEWRVAKILSALQMLPVDVRLCPGQAAFQANNGEFCRYGRVPMLKLQDRPLADWGYTIKTWEDRILATVILLLISPLMLAIAVAIKIETPGPVFFRQYRYGFNNHLIEVFKFRTMYHEQRDETAEQLTRRNDPRVTPLGAFLRRFSLDELPQFINVLRGEMSIVGPRPHAVAAKAAGIRYGDAVPRYAARHRMKPGITGWAQVNGWRGETKTLEQIEKRVEHDLYYIERWSLWFDLKIVLLTILKGFSGKNAY